MNRVTRYRRFRLYFDFRIFIPIVDSNPIHLLTFLLMIVLKIVTTLLMIHTNLQPYFLNEKVITLLLTNSLDLFWCDILFGKETLLKLSKVGSNMPQRNVKLFHFHIIFILKQNYCFIFYFKFSNINFRCCMVS